MSSFFKKPKTPEYETTDFKKEFFGAADRAVEANRANSNRETEDFTKTYGPQMIKFFADQFDQYSGPEFKNAESSSYKNLQGITDTGFTGAANAGFKQAQSNFLQASASQGLGPTSGAGISLASKRTADQIQANQLIGMQGLAGLNAQKTNRIFSFFQPATNSFMTRLQQNIINPGAAGQLAVDTSFRNSAGRYGAAQQAMSAKSPFTAIAQGAVSSFVGGFSGSVGSGLGGGMMGGMGGGAKPGAGGGYNSAGAASSAAPGSSISYSQGTGYTPMATAAN